jgi:hypothetical protein
VPAQEALSAMTIEADLSSILLLAVKSLPKALKLKFGNIRHTYTNFRIAKSFLKIVKPEN